MENIARQLEDVVDRTNEIKDYLGYENKEALITYMENDFNNSIDEIIEKLKKIKINKGE